MITIKKLRTLKDGTRLRKYIVILKELESTLIEGRDLNLVYYRSVLNEISCDICLNSSVQLMSKENITLRNINNIRHQIMKQLGIEPSEWDFTAPPDQNEKKLKTGMNLYLEDIRSPFNLGSLFRSAECFAVNRLYLSPNCCSPDHNRAIRTSMGTIDMMEWEVINSFKPDIPVFALELGGEPIDSFNFPEEGIAIIGSEELGVSPDALKIAENSLGRVTIPLFGRKSSLNVANATAILLQRWSESLRKKLTLF